MSWYQALDGAEVCLSTTARKRVGIDGFGVEDSGVLGNIDAVVNVLKVGNELGGLTERQLQCLFNLEDGSVEQSARASKLCSRALSGLEKTIEETLASALSNGLKEQPRGIKDYVEWARGSGWEFPVSWDDESNRTNPQLVLGDTCGLCVMEVNTEGLSTDKRKVLTALIELLSIESYKTTILDQLLYRLDMYGLHADAKNEAVNGDVTLDDDELLKWIKRYDNDALENLAADFEGNEEFITFWVRLFYDTLVVKQELEKTMSQLLGVNNSKSEDRVAKTLVGISKEVATWKACELKSFVQWCVNELAGETTAELFQRIDNDDEFNGMPGQYAVIVTGVDLDVIGDVLSEINEYACSGDDQATVGLSGDAKDIAAFLSRITLAERMLLMLAAMSENGSLSELELAA